jgi:hypothetical protein
VKREVLYNILIEFGIPQEIVSLIKMCLIEACSKVHIGKHLSDSFPIQDHLKQGDALSPVLFNFALDYAIRKVLDNQVVLKLNGTHQLLAYADDLNVLGDNTNTINKNTETLNGASKEVGLKVNIEKTMYLLVYHCQNAGKHHDIKIGNRSFENVSQFKYFNSIQFFIIYVPSRTTVTNQNLIKEEIKRRLNSGNACYHSAQNLLSSSLLSKNVKVRIYKTIILPVVLYWCKTWSLTVREEHKPRVFENRVLRRISGPKRNGVTGGWRKLHNEELHNLYSSPSKLEL